MDKEEIPDLVAQIKDHEARLPDANRAVEDVRGDAREVVYADTCSRLKSVKMRLRKHAVICRPS